MTEDEADDLVREIIREANGLLASGTMGDVNLAKWIQGKVQEAAGPLAAVFVDQPERGVFNVRIRPVLKIDVIRGSRDWDD
jgi:hypothetical protein